MSRVEPAPSQLLPTHLATRSILNDSAITQKFFMLPLARQQNLRRRLVRPVPFRNLPFHLYPPVGGCALASTLGHVAEPAALHHGLEPGQSIVCWLCLGSGLLGGGFSLEDSWIVSPLDICLCGKQSQLLEIAQVIAIQRSEGQADVLCFAKGRLGPVGERSAAVSTKVSLGSRVVGRGVALANRRVGFVVKKGVRG